MRARRGKDILWTSNEMSAQTKNRSEETRLAGAMDLIRRQFAINSDTLDINIKKVHADLLDVRTSTGHSVEGLPPTPFRARRSSRAHKTKLLPRRNQQETTKVTDADEGQGQGQSQGRGEYSERSESPKTLTFPGLRRRSHTTFAEDMMAQRNSVDWGLCKTCSAKQRERSESAVKVRSQPTTLALKDKKVKVRMPDLTPRKSSMSGKQKKVKQQDHQQREGQQKQCQFDTKKNQRDSEPNDNIAMNNIGERTANHSNNENRNTQTVKATDAAETATVTSESNSSSSTPTPSHTKQLHTTDVEETEPAYATVLDSIPEAEAQTVTTASETTGADASTDDSEERLQKDTATECERLESDPEQGQNIASDTPTNQRHSTLQDGNQKSDSEERRPRERMTESEQPGSGPELEQHRASDAETNSTNPNHRIRQTRTEKNDFEEKRQRERMTESEQLDPELEQHIASDTPTNPRHRIPQNGNKENDSEERRPKERRTEYEQHTASDTPTNSKHRTPQNGNQKNHSQETPPTESGQPYSDLGEHLASDTQTNPRHRTQQRNGKQKIDSQETPSTESGQTDSDLGKHLASDIQTTPRHRTSQNRIQEKNHSQETPPIESGQPDWDLGEHLASDIKITPRHRTSQNGIQEKNHSEERPPTVPLNQNQENHTNETPPTESEQSDLGPPGQNDDRRASIHPLSQEIAEMIQHVREKNEELLAVKAAVLTLRKSKRLLAANVEDVEFVPEDKEIDVHVDTRKDLERMMLNKLAQSSRSRGPLPNIRYRCRTCLERQRDNQRYRQWLEAASGTTDNPTAQPNEPGPRAGAARPTVNVGASRGVASGRGSGISQRLPNLPAKNLDGNVVDRSGRVKTPGGGEVDAESDAASKPTTVAHNLVTGGTAKKENKEKTTPRTTRNKETASQHREGKGAEKENEKEKEEKEVLFNQVTLLAKTSPAPEQTTNSSNNTPPPNISKEPSSNEASKDDDLPEEQTTDEADDSIVIPFLIPRQKKGWSRARLEKLAEPRLRGRLVRPRIFVGANVLRREAEVMRQPHQHKQMTEREHEHLLKIQSRVRMFMAVLQQQETLSSSTMVHIPQRDDIMYVDITHLG